MQVQIYVQILDVWFALVGHASEFVAVCGTIK